MEIPLSKDDVVSGLWSKYQLTDDFRNGLTEAIPAHSFLVEEKEKTGLKNIYCSFVENLQGKGDSKKLLQAKSPSDWIDEWKIMHKTLFKEVLKKCGDFRKKSIRFGDPGDEDLHDIPAPHMVLHELGKLTEQIGSVLLRNLTTLDEKCQSLAEIHYQFIRIHPFSDGNGRIARAITDQLALYFDLPPAMAGYPRSEQDRRKQYHEAIRSCVEDPRCVDLSKWIKQYVEIKLNDIIG